ncbi:MarR family winged helix-turn-helix transcriptional regulator [Planctomycetota bacterium]
MLKNKINLPLFLEYKPHEALVSVWWTGLLLKKEAKQFFRPYISSEAQFNILMILKYTKQALTQNDLSQRLLVDKSNITGLVDRMEDLNFIKRNKIKNDRRSYHITLTAKGKKMIDKLDKLYIKKIEAIMSAFSEKEQNDMIRLTKKMRQGLADDAREGDK